MVIKRILTNNAVIIEEENKEKIVCGKGIAYKKKIGSVIDDSLINKSFILENNDAMGKYEQLLKDVPIEYIQLSYDIVEMAKVEFEKSFSDTMVVTLSEHLYAAIQRCKEGQIIRNALLWDIQQYYELEYKIGIRAIQMIKEKKKVELPEDEAGFIALHIVNAQIDSANIEKIYKVTEVIKEITTIVKYHFATEVVSNSVYYYRFITHLKFFALRLFNDQQYSENDEEDLLSIIKEKYNRSYDCVIKIRDFISKKYGYQLQGDEMSYLTIHIQRILNKTSKGEE
ncbi:beta-glucoside bgl operon antiterminator, BglG family [Lachnospiraceae bacterium KM106-2]|nr:beta-glucoside bgl operon antiterminator, BglG family [Lachnospiraceae bacterium KM106-2]